MEYNGIIQYAYEKKPLPFSIVMAKVPAIGISRNPATINATLPK